MKEELQGKLVEILTGIQGAVGKGSDFVMEQLPDIAQQYVAFGRVWNILFAVFSLTLLCVALYLFIVKGLNSKLPDTSYGDWPGARIAFTIVGAGGLVPTLVATCVSIHDLALVWLAPKVWLLIEIAGLIKHK